MNINELNRLNPGAGSAVSGADALGNGTADGIKSGRQGEFGAMLEDALENVNDQMLQSGEMVQKMASGEDVDIADTMISVTKAGISFRMLLQVRNKALSAYEEIMRMSV